MYASWYIFLKLRVIFRFRDILRDGYVPYLSIFVDLEVPMELHHYNQYNYIPLRDIVEYAACQDYVWNIFSAIIQPFQQAMSASFNTPKCKLSSYSGQQESFFKFLLGMIQHLLKV